MIPLLQLGIFVGLVSLPVNFIPWTIVALYDTVLWLTEPAWLIIEGWQIVYLCMVISKVLVQNIEENEFMFKGIILSIAGISYLMTAWLIPKTLFAESSVISGFTIILIVATIVMHLYMWMSEPGTISDAAGLSFYCFFLLYAMSSEMSSSLKMPSVQPIDSASNQSFVQLFLTMMTSAAGSFNTGLEFLKKIVSPYFVLLSVVRLATVMTFVSSQLSKWFPDNKSDYEVDESENVYLHNNDNDNNVSEYSAWKSPLILRLVAIFVYTQLVTNHIHRTTLPRSETTSLIAWYMKLLPVGVIPGRLLQITIIFCLYMYNVQRDDINNDDW